MEKKGTGLSVLLFNRLTKHIESGPKIQQWGSQNGEVTAKANVRWVIYFYHLILSNPRRLKLFFTEDVKNH